MARCLREVARLLFVRFLEWAILVTGSRELSRLAMSAVGALQTVNAALREYPSFDVTDHVAQHLCAFTRTAVGS